MPILSSNSISSPLLPIIDPAAPDQPLPPRGPYIDHVGSLAACRNSTPHPLTSSSPHSPLPTPHSPLAPLVASRAEMQARGWDEVDVVFVTGDAYVDHPSFAMALLGRLLEERRLSRRHPQPARLAYLRAVAHVRPAAAVLRHQRRQHGLDDQPLHGQSQSPQRRRLQPRRTDRPPTRPRDAGLLPACPRGVSRACRSSPAASKPACGASPITTIGATRSAARSCSTARPTCWSTAWASGRSSKSPGDSPPAQTVRDLRDMRGVAYRLGAKRSSAVRHPNSALIDAAAPSLPSYEAVSTDRQAAPSPR